MLRSHSSFQPVTVFGDQTRSYLVGALSDPGPCVTTPLTSREGSHGIDEWAGRGAGGMRWALRLRVASTAGTKAEGGEGKGKERKKR